MDEDEILKLELVLNGVEEQGDAADVTKWERDFVDDTRQRYEQYGSRTRFSEKQWAIIERIYDKVI